ncbi:hypothetical protein SteCoe_10173 [Stentor coeruleus]|uniref:Cyclic nucleotide-binding domain-containing protein n=1 Tax=Stentor coeruleus TaxID=5963 RepID=A0A1R2CG86_9CILI|nr:hypothetical protein SteCoe_10173 [Stentor coeruleus]
MSFKSPCFLFSEHYNINIMISSQVYMNSLASLLEIPCGIRKQSDLDQIGNFCSLFKFFQEVQEQQSASETMQEICKILTVKNYSPREFIFKTGDQAENFYFLLKGSVKVFSNTYVEIEDPGDDEIHRMIRKNLEVTKIRVRKNRDSIPETQMAVLNPGDGFGEAAIINDRPRYFSVVTSEFVTVAVLNKNDYFKLEGTQEKLINEKIDFLRTIEAFKTWSRVSLYNLAFFVKELKYLRGTIVYSEGDIPNVIYLIKEGEFKFTQRFSINAGSKVFANNKGGKDSSGLLSPRNSTFRTKDLQVVTKQAGEMFGIEEIYDKLPGRLFTCTCVSQTGKLFYISEKTFAKKVTNPESLKIIEDQCKTFKNWIYPRLEELKKLEIFKDDNSYTPYQKIKLTPRSLKSISQNPVRTYDEYIPDSKILPLILKKIIRTKYNQSSNYNSVNRQRIGSVTMFKTELEESDQFNHSNINNSFQFGAGRKSYFNPIKLSQLGVKKIKTNNI